jgi:hypothetical protein
MLSFLNKYAGNVHSQNGEDLIAQECLRRLEIKTGHAVEIGGNDGLWMSNTRYLIEQGWSGLFVEYNYNLYLQSKANWANNPKIRHQCCKVDGKNINAFVKDNCDLLSVDTDGMDFRIFEGLKAKPKIVILEVDSSIPPGSYETNSDGASGYQQTVELGIKKGYFLLCHTGNIILIANKYRYLFPEIVGDGLSNSALYFNRSWMKEEAA